MLQGVKGQPVSEICPEHHISQAQSDPWRDQVLVPGSRACETHADGQREQRLADGHARRKKLVGELES